MRYFIAIIGLIISINLFGQEISKKELKYVPNDFNESLTQLDKIFPDSTKTEILQMTEDEFMRMTHLSTGMWIRNYWLYNRYLFGLIVTQSNLRKELINKGLFHNDDMSSVILCSYYRKTHNIDLNVEQQIEEIHQFYVNINNPEWRRVQDSITRVNYMKSFELGDTLKKHLYYDRNWLGEPRKNTEVLAKIVDKSDSLLKIEVISFGTESNHGLVFEQMECDSTDSWIYPYFWINLNEE